MLMNRKQILVIVATMSLLYGLSLPAEAITFGEPDGEAHPYVAQLIFYDEGGDFITPCTGTLISSTAVLTAAHCVYGAARAIVLFNADLNSVPDPTMAPSPPSCSYFSGFDCYEAEDLYLHPDYLDSWPELPNTYDVGVVVLTLAKDMDEYGELPELGVLDQPDTQRGRQDQIFRKVGYGLQSVKPFYQIDHRRYTSTSMLVNLRSHLTDGYNLHTSNNPGRANGIGGQCFGDSGGPVFYPEDSKVVVGIVSFGLNRNCKGADFAYRTDIPVAQDFINDVLNGD